MPKTHEVNLIMDTFHVSMEVAVSLWYEFNRKGC